MKNKHAVSIPQEVLEQVQAIIDTATALLAPYLLSLTPEERHSLLKMGNKMLSFVEKAQAYARHYPQLCPTYLNITEFDTDVTDATGLRTIRISTEQLSDNISDTVMLAGSEAYQTALVFYKAVKAAAAQDILGAKEVYNDLKSHFPRTKRKNQE
jgi:hypothetical protein